MKTDIKSLERAAKRIVVATGLKFVSIPEVDESVSDKSINFVGFHVQVCSYTGHPMLVEELPGPKFRYHDHNPSIKAIIAKIKELQQ